MQFLVTKGLPFLSQWPHGLRRRLAAAPILRLWVRIPKGHGCLSHVSVLCSQVEVSATSGLLFQNIPTDCGASIFVTRSGISEEVITRTGRSATRQKKVLCFLLTGSISQRLDQKRSN
jgi:hypothetical protein